MLSFDNTENAFKAKNNDDLKRSHFLFKMIGKPWLVKFGSATAPFGLKIGFKGLIKRTIFKQFVGGETIEDCNKTIANLAQYNIGSILDYSVEGKESEPDLDHCCEETIATIKRAKGDKNIPFCVFKTTGLARFALLEKVTAREQLNANELQEWERVRKRVEKISAAAQAADKPLFIDAEDSWIQQAIDDLADENMARFNKEKPIVHNTFQLYRHDRLAFLKTSYEKALAEGYFIGAKLVRGAYMEKERERAQQKGYKSPIHATKEDSDRDYDNAVAFCVEHIERFSLCAGTHNENSSMSLAKLMEKKGIQKNDTRIWFSQLLGMSDHISYNLAIAGYNVCKYVPYGPVNEVLPYLLRRAQENTSVKGQTGRELSLIIKEKNRRSALKN